MPEFRLTASPAITRATVEIAETRLSSVELPGVHTLVLRAGDPDRLAAEFKDAIGDLPDVGRSTQTSAGEVLRPSLERAYLLWNAPDLSEANMLYAVDQTSFWAVISLSGPGALPILERCWKPALSDSVFPVGAVARSNIAQIATILHRTGSEDYRLMAPRSYGESLFQDLERAMSWVL